MLYFASGKLDLPGAMFTASHNPAQYNGIKLCRAGASPVGQDTGLAEIRARTAENQADAEGATPGRLQTATCSSTTRLPAQPGRPEAASGR